MALKHIETGWHASPGTGAWVDTKIDIDLPPRVVFDYVTTPALWSTWHPATAEVREVPNRPLVVGETALELIVVAGRRDWARWRVEACTAPWRWEISTDTDHGSAYITYRITPAGSGSRFHRTLEFRSKHWPWRALDSTLTRWLLVRQSKQALRRLKAVLEG